MGAQDQGLDPTLTAVLPLVGVLIGALLAGGASYLLTRRNERKERRAVARLLMLEMVHMANVLDFAVDTGRFPSDAIDDLAGTAWEQHAVQLARHMTPEQWETVSVGYSAAIGVRSAIQAEELSPLQMEAVVLRAQAKVDEAGEELSRVVNDRVNDPLATYEEACRWRRENGLWVADSGS